MAENNLEENYIIERSDGGFLIYKTDSKAEAEAIKKKNREKKFIR